MTDFISDCDCIVKINVIFSLKISEMKALLVKQYNAHARQKLLFDEKLFDIPVFRRLLFDIINVIMNWITWTFDKIRALDKCYLIEKFMIHDS